MAVSPMVFQERMTLKKLSGFAAVIAGMYLVNKNGLFKTHVSAGLIFGILSAAMYALMVIFNKKAKSITGLENSAFQLIISFLTVAVFMQTKQSLDASSVFHSLFPVLFLGIVNTGIGCYFYFLPSVGCLQDQWLSADISNHCRLSYSQHFFSESACRRYSFWEPFLFLSLIHI